MSLTVTCSVALLDGPAGRARARARTSWCTPSRSSTPARGTLSLYADQIRQVGVGELLARLEHLRSVLAAEGLFAADRKRPLPFLPGVVGRGLRPGVGRREGRRRERPAPLARRAVPGRGGRRAGADRGHRGHRRAAAPRRRPRGRRHRRDPRRRVARGPAAVLQRGAGARGRRPAARRSSARSATRPTPRCSTWSPTSAPPRRPTRPSGSSPTSSRSSTGSPSCGRRTGAAVRVAARPRGRRPARPAQPAGAGRPAQPARRRREQEVVGDARPVPPGAHGRARPGGRQPGAHPRPGHGAVAGRDAGPRLRRAAARRRCRRTPGRPRSRPATRCAPGWPRARSSVGGAAVGWPPCPSRRPTSDRPTSRPARSSSRWCAGSRPAAATLEESLALWERGEALAAICQEWLDGARARLDAGRGRATTATPADRRLLARPAARAARARSSRQDAPPTTTVVTGSASSTRARGSRSPPSTPPPRGAADHDPAGVGRPRRELRRRTSSGSPSLCSSPA